MTNTINCLDFTDFCRELSPTVEEYTFFPCEYSMLTRRDICWTIKQVSKTN